MEKAGNIMEVMKIFCMKENIRMEKEMEKVKNILVVNLWKEYINMEIGYLRYKNIRVN